MNTHHDIHILYCNKYFKLLTICVIIPIYMTYCIYIKYISNVKVTSSPDQIYPFTARWPGGWRMEEPCGPQRTLVTDNAGGRVTCHESCDEDCDV